MSSSPTTAALAQDFADVLRQIQQSRQRVFAQANTALIELYGRIGQMLSDQGLQRQEPLAHEAVLRGLPG